MDAFDIVYGIKKRTTIRLSDERQRLLEEGSKIAANGPDDDPPMSDVIDAALTHLVEASRTSRMLATSIHLTLSSQSRTRAFMRCATGRESRVGGGSRK